MDKLDHSTPESRALMALVEWSRAQGLAVTALEVGGCRIELMPTRSGGALVPRETPVSSMYAAYGGELFDEATRTALGATGADDLVPVVSQ